ncbi:MAG: hypothetical protein IT170_18515 [Bryobacterales bacterium]|nr:hypothetical protein [Bryobacterales bacterium]
MQTKRTRCRSGFFFLEDMMNIRTLQQKKADLARQARSLLESAGADGLTSEQKTQYESLKAQIVSVNELIEAHESQVEIERSLMASDPVPDFRPTARIEVGPPNSDSDPKGGGSRTTETFWSRSWTPAPAGGSTRG